MRRVHERSYLVRVTERTGDLCKLQLFCCSYSCSTNDTTSTSPLRSNCHCVQTKTAGTVQIFKQRYMITSSIWIIWHFHTNLAWTRKQEIVYVFDGGAPSLKVIRSMATCGHSRGNKEEEQSAEIRRRREEKWSSSTEGEGRSAQVHTTGPPNRVTNCWRGLVPNATNTLVSYSSPPISYF